jgi:hypothetical protein
MTLLPVRKPGRGGHEREEVLFSGGKGKREAPGAKKTFIVKSGFGKVFQIFIFFQVIYKLYRQVLTSIENSSLLLKLRIFNKSRLATLYKTLNTKKYSTTNWFHLD